METLSSSCLSNLCEALSGALERLVLTKDIIIKILSNKKYFLWIYRDSSKRPLENNFFMERERMEHTLDGGHMQMATVDPKAQLKSLLSDCT